MSESADQGGEAPCWAHFVDDLDRSSSPFTARRSNTILYCDDWSDVVAFYRDGLGLRPTAERDWFVEFEIHPSGYLSVADATRATVGAGDGSGLTLSWCVDDVDTVIAHLAARGVDTSAVVNRWGSRCCDVFDPAGNRIEFWSPPDVRSAPPGTPHDPSGPS